MKQYARDRAGAFALSGDLVNRLCVWRNAQLCQRPSVPRMRAVSTRAGQPGRLPDLSQTDRLNGNSPLGALAHLQIGQAYAKRSTRNLTDIKGWPTLVAFLCESGGLRPQPQLPGSDRPGVIACWLRIGQGQRSKGGRHSSVSALGISRSYLGSKSSGPRYG
jgi:hypothetical protein